MADPVICNVCRAEITNPAEQIDRNYTVKATGHQLPSQKKHNACDAVYATKAGLEKKA
jgi:hypothetical protein